MLRIALTQMKCLSAIVDRRAVAAACTTPERGACQAGLKALLPSRPKRRPARQRDACRCARLLQSDWHTMYYYAYILLARAAPAIWLNKHRSSEKVFGTKILEKSALIGFAHDFFELRSFSNHQDKNERRSCFAHPLVSALTSARSMSGALELVAI
jgi:hypothetical protein